MKTCLKEEHKLPVDVRGSKTSVFKLSTNLSRRFREDCGTSCGTDYTLYQDLVMDTSVYLVGNGGLLAQTTTQKLCLCLFICLRFYCVKKNE